MRRIIGAQLLALTALIALLALTTAYALAPHAPAKPWVALVIAVLKSAIVVAIFMNLRTSSPLVRAAAIAALVWLGLLFALSWTDYAFRPS